MSFQRTLVSVRDLVDQYGSVLFDRKGVHVVSKVGSEGVVTTIGKPTESRLYSFVLGRMADHDQAVERLKNRRSVDGAALAEDNGDHSMGARKSVYCDSTLHDRGGNGESTLVSDCVRASRTLMLIG